MTKFDTVRKNLEANGFAVTCFATKEEACDYLNQKLDGRTIGFGGSITLKEMGLYDTLSTHNETHWHWVDGPTECPAAATAQVYFSSVNGLAETGEIVNIDGNCNRISATMYGHDELYLVVGKNKLAGDYDAALWRARNVAAPKNAQRMSCKTPCAVNGDKCYDCKSPARICRALTVLWRKPKGLQHAEVVLIDEELGY